MARRDSAPRRFADAAFEIALRDDTIDTWRKELDAAAETAATDELRGVLANPAIPLDQRMDVAEKVFASLSRPVLNLVLLLLKRGRIEQLPRVAAEFRRLDDQRNNIVHATVTSAAPLEADEVEAIRSRLEGLTGSSVDLETSVDTDLLGGVVVRVGDRLIDGSVRGRLERLRNQLAAGAL
jgi:F-type H+-transporting ATPase subunit delta